MGDRVLRLLRDLPLIAITMVAYCTVALAKVNLVAFALLLVGFLLTFPPAMDVLQGK